MTKSYVSGLDEAMRNLRKQADQIEGKTLKGLIRGGLIIRRESQRLSPVVTGNLKASAYVVASTGSAPAGQSPKFKGENASEMQSNHSQTLAGRQAAVKAEQYPTVEVGYTAVYALRVHENPRAGKTGDPGASEVGQWKFLETAIKNNEAEILRVIAKEAKV